MRYSIVAEIRAMIPAALNTLMASGMGEPRPFRIVGENGRSTDEAAWPLCGVWHHRDSDDSIGVGGAVIWILSNGRFVYQPDPPRRTLQSISPDHLDMFHLDRVAFELNRLGGSNKRLAFLDPLTAVAIGATANRAIRAIVVQPAGTVREADVPNFPFAADVLDALIAAKTREPVSVPLPNTRFTVSVQTRKDTALFTVQFSPGRKIGAIPVARVLASRRRMTSSELRLLTPDWRSIAELETPFVAVLPDPSMLTMKLGVGKQAIDRIVDTASEIAAGIGEKAIGQLVQLHAARSELAHSSTS